MRLPTFKSSLILAIASALCSLPSLAALVNFNPDLNGKTGSLQAKLQIQKLGSVTIPRGRAAISGNSIEITTIPEWQFDRQVVLSGTMLKTEAQVSGRQVTIRGIAYFQDGDWMTYIDNKRSLDEIETEDGTVVGRITSIEDTDLVVQDETGKSRRIPRSTLKNIYSPRSYTFTIPATAVADVTGGAPIQAEATQFDLKPTAHTFRLAVLRSDLAKQTAGQDWSTGKLVLVYSLLTALETAQFVPELALPLRSGHEWRVEEKKVFNTLTGPAATPTTVLPLSF